MSDAFTGKIYSTDSAKAIKAQKAGWLNAIMYMAPHKTAGVGNLCSHASPDCIALCLGWYSGQADMVKNDSDINNVRKSRILKAIAFMRDRVRFMRRVALAIAIEYRRAVRLKMLLCVRNNGSQDVAWEGIRVDVDEATARALSRLLGRKVLAGLYSSLMALFHDVQFVDYTKNPHRMTRNLPSNYHLTFSRSAKNEADALEVLRRGGNVAVCFGDGLPETWQGFPVIDGDVTDLRHLDPRGGYVVGLSPKGRKARRDFYSGFVVWTDKAELARRIAKHQRYVAAQERRKARLAPVLLLAA